MLLRDRLPWVLPLLRCGSRLEKVDCVMLKNDGEVRTIDGREGVIQYCYEGTDIWSVLLTGGFARDYCGWQLTPIVKCYRVYERDGLCWYRHRNLKTGDCEKGSFCEFQQPREAKNTPVVQEAFNDFDLYGLLKQSLPLEGKRYDLVVEAWFDDKGLKLRNLRVWEEGNIAIVRKSEVKEPAPESPPQLFICENASKCPFPECEEPSHRVLHQHLTSCHIACVGRYHCVPAEPEKADWFVVEFLQDAAEFRIWSRVLMTKDYALKCIKVHQLNARAFSLGSGVQ